MMVKEMLKMKLKKDDKNVLNTGIATLNLDQQNPVLLETAQACVETPDGKRSELQRIPFDKGSQISFIMPRAKSLLNLVAKGNNEY